MGNALKCLMLSLLLAVVAGSVGCGTQALFEEQTSELPPSVDPFIGTWNFNVEKSTFDPGPGPRSMTWTFEDREGGLILATLEGTDAQWNQALSQVAFKYDGNDYPRVSQGAKTVNSVSYKYVDEYTVQIVRKADGEVTSTGTRTISKDGKTMTIDTGGTNAQGQQTSSFQVFERQSTDPSHFFGTWILNVEKSTFDPGPARKSGTDMIEDRGKGVILLTRKSIDDQGNRIFAQYAAKYDGKDYPFFTLGAKAAISVSHRLVDAYTVEGITKVDGKVNRTDTRTVSKDGKTMTFTEHGTNAQGEPFKWVMVHERQ